MTYKLTTGDAIMRIVDGACIPPDPDNSDYAQYLSWLAEGNTPDPADVPSLAERVAAAVRQIDADADAIYGAVLGNRGEEYKSAEADAQAYRDAAYAGPVPAGVASWVAASGMTAQAAADDILATATAWRDAMAQIRAERLLRKAQAQTDVDAALADWASFAAGVRASLGLS